MKRYIWLLCLLVLIGCSNGSSPTSPSNAPAISNLNYSPRTATVGQGGGAVTVTGTIDFIDLDGDVTTLILSTTGGEISGPIQGISGMTNGTIAITAIVSTTTAGNYSFQVWVVDSRGNASNKLTGTFTVQ